jgi:hypothetical protein
VSSVWFGVANVRCETEGGGDDFSIDPLGREFDLPKNLTQRKSELVNPLTRTVIIGGMEGTRITGVSRKDDSFMGGGGWFYDDIYVQQNGQYWHIGYFTTDGADTLKTEFTKFIGTFSFTK